MVILSFSYIFILSFTEMKASSLPRQEDAQKKMIKKQLNKKLDESRSSTVKNNIKESIALIDSSDAHPRRPR